MAFGVLNLNVNLERESQIPAKFLKTLSFQKANKILEL